MINKPMIFMGLAAVLSVIGGCQPVRDIRAVDTPVVEPVQAIKPQQDTATSFHAKCVPILNAYVDEEGMVDYKRLRPKRLELIEVIRCFDELDPNEYDSWSEADKKAFWINAYNLCTLKVVVNNYPIKPSRFKSIFYPANSIMQLAEPWSRYEFSIMNEKYTLKDIERRILLRNFGDPRICFAISYASRGGLPLRNEPYCGSRLEEQLTDQIKKFISSEQGFKIDRENGKVYLSVIFQPTWYGQDFIKKYGTERKFGDKEPEVRAALNFISNYTSRKDIDFLTRKSYSIKYIKYDWRLNEQR